MSYTSKTSSLSKGLSVEESFSSSKRSTTISSSSVSSSSKLESSRITSSSSFDKDSGISSSSLVSRIADSDLDSAVARTEGLKLSSLEKSSSLEQTEDSFLSRKSEVAKSLDVQDSSSKMSVMSSKEEVSMSKSESASEKKAISKSESMSSEISEEKPSVYVVVMDYTPRSTDMEGLPVSEGQEVEVIDSSRAHKWRVRLRKDGSEGTVPSCYLERKTFATPTESPQLDPKAQSARVRRERVLHEFLESEEAFARDMQFVVNNYVKEMESKSIPKDLREDAVFNNFKAISEFHNNVLMKGIQYYADDPSRLGKTFLRLERDFDKHVSYCRDEPEAQQLLQSGPLKEYFDDFSKKLEDEKSLSEHLKLPIQRINDYQLLLKELIKYGARLRESTADLEKALDFMQAIPQRATDLHYINSIQGYKGNLHKLGRIIKHDWFELTDAHSVKRERLLFLFKGRIFITDQKKVGSNRSAYLVKHVIKLPDVEIVDNADDDELKLRFHNLKTGASVLTKAKSLEQKEEWLTAIQSSAGPQVEDLGDEDLDVVEEQQRVEELYEKHETTRLDAATDEPETYDEGHTVVTESIRSGSLTSLEDFQSALDDEPSLCLTASEVETGGAGKPRFLFPLKAVTCAEGMEAVLECEVCSSPEATVAWLKDNAPLTGTSADGRASLREDGGRHTLVIRRAECADSGLYTLIASNVHGTTSCSAPLAVSSAPGTLAPTGPDGTPMQYGPVFREKLRDTELQEGTDFRVCVIVEGEPTPKLTFYKNDVEIGCRGRVRFSRETDECYELVIDKAEKEDAANYSCVACSAAGRNVTACNIAVTRPKQFVTFDDEAERTSTPDNVDLNWPKEGGGMESESSEHFKVTIDDSDTVSLLFQHVTPSDDGMYTCVANTSSGKISCSAELTVQGGLPRDPEKPKLSAASKIVEAKEGSSALLEMTATGFPPPVITWTKDGEELVPGGKYAMLAEDEETFTLAIKDLKPEDAGQYTAEAINESGQDEIAYQLKVTGPPKFSKQMKESMVMLNEDAEFAVEIEGSPEPTIAWCKDGQQLSPSDRVKIVDEGKLKKLVIKKAQLEDAGKYSCILKNEHGSQGGYGALKVNAPPKFVKGMGDQSVCVGKEASCTVSVSGDPQPTLKWLKDGKELKVDGSHVVVRKKSDSTYVFSVKETVLSDAGEYACEITNEHGQEISKGRLTVNEKPVFKKKLKDLEVEEGEDFELKVNINGTPKPTIKWSKDGGDVKIDGEHVILREEEDGNSLTLKVHESTSEDSGSYKCTITNVEGSETTTSKVTVKEEEEEEVIEGKVVKEERREEVKEEREEKKTERRERKEETREERKEEEVKAPSFKKELSDVSVKEGETVELAVEYTGNPKIKWAKDGEDIEMDGDHYEYRKEDADDSLTLVIKDAKKEDSGKYTCTITNSSGSACTSSDLSVIAEEALPVFTKGLKDTSVVEGQNTEFSVKFTGSPKIKWSKDGADLKIGNNLDLFYIKEQAEDSLTLVLNRAKLADSGEYTCTLSNEAGSTSTRGKLDVKAKPEAPTFQKGLKDQTVQEGETAEFTVKFSGTPKPAARWDKDGAELSLFGKRLELRYEEDEDSLTLVLNSATKDDAGTYACVITNTEGEDKTSSKLKVSETETSATFRKKLEDVTVVEEDTVELKVEYKGNPKPTTKWQKDGNEITIDDDHYELTSKDDTETLTINDVTTEDSGKYTCTIKNSAGSESTTSKVTVKEETAEPKFLKGLKDQSVKEEQMVKLTVKFSGKPKPKAKWTKDGAELTIDNSRIKSVEEAEDSLTIVIKDSTVTDSGKYSCTISNSHGSDTTTSKLTVSEGTSAPEFTQKLKDKEVKEGTTAEFNVKFSGKPTPTAKWTLDGDELTIDGGHTQLKVEEEGASLTVVIRDVSKEDGGKYACKITNASGSQSTSGKLTVAVAPKFTKPLEDVDAEQGATLRLNVKFEGQPEPTVSWKREGVTLETDGRHVRTTIESDESMTLVVEKASSDDVGSYSCEITNAHGKDSTSAKVSITGKPVVKKSFGDRQAKEGDKDVEFEVEATATPQPDVKWFLNGTPLLDGDNVKIVSDNDSGIHKLILKEIGPDMAGEIKCEISNDSGTADCKGKLSLLSKPCFVKELKDVTLNEGDTLILETEVTGSPKPTVKWYKGRKELVDERSSAESDGQKHSLVLEDASLDDSGSYSVKAENEAGTISQQAVVTVQSRKDTQAPVFVTHLYDQVIVVDDAGRLEAKITGSPKPTVTWSKSGTVLEEGDRVLIKSSEDSDTYTLTLKGLKVADTAKYTCKAVNDYGTAKEEAQLTIKEPVAPQIEPMENIDVPIGAPARLKAKITGFPKPDVTWFRDDVPIKNDDVFEVTCDGDARRYAVAVKAVRSEEIGRYVCRATNQAGEAKAECMLAIKGQPPVFSRDPKGHTVDLGDEFKVEAEVFGFPTPQITWLKDGKPVEKEGPYKISQYVNTHRLEGTLHSLDDAGVFTIKATNNAGEESRTAAIKVLDFEPEVSEKLPSSVETTEGEPLVLTAKVVGKPIPEIKWVKDGKPVRPSNRVRCSLSPEGTAELKITEAKPEDAGHYKMVAMNERGEAATETDVAVAPRPKTVKPFVSQLQPVDVVVGKTILLEAKVTGDPQPKIQWLKDGAEVDKRHAVVLETGNKATLRIDEAVLGDAGEYSITATNDDGQDGSTTTVKVATAGKKPQIVKELKAGKLMEGEEGQLKVVVSGHPMPTVSWLHNGKNVLEGTHCSIVMDEGGTATLTLHGVKPEDAGKYLALVSNKHGKASSEAPVMVVPAAKEESEKEKKPSKKFAFLKSLMPQLVPEGKPCILEAVVTTDPKPMAVKWTKDGKDIPPSERIHVTQDFETGVLKLAIDQMTPADRGKYVLSVTDGASEIRCDALANMMPTMPGMSGNKPQFIKGLEPIKVSEGETIVLQAQLAPDSGCSIKWTKNGDDISKNGRTQMLQQSNGAVALIVEAAVPEDSGKYVVIATNDEGKTRSSAQVAVVGDGFKLPEIVDSLKATPFVQGEPGKLTAKVSGEPLPDVKWLKNGAPVEPSDRIRTRCEPDGTVVLEIDRVRPDDAGKYTVLASNVGGETRTSADVQVIQSPLFLSPLEAVTGVEDCPAKLECRVAGDPLPEIQWTKDGQPVPDDDSNLSKRRLPSGEVALVLSKCIPSDAGNYTCTATNEHGQKASSAPLSVIGKEVSGESKIAPSFIRPLSDLRVQDGEMFRLEAEISGNPLPQVSWLLDGQPVSVCDTIVPAFDGKKASLSVYRCNPRHAGKYECRLSNVLGEAKSDAKVDVDAQRPPTFTQKLSDMQFVSSDPVVLSCRVEGIPDPDVSWWHNRDRLDSGAKYNIQRDGDRCSLALPHPRPRDSGLYECRAVNLAGKAACSANVAITGAETEGEPPMFLKKLKDTSAINGMTAKLTACICGSPKPVVQWFKDGNELSEEVDSRLTLEYDPNGVLRLIVRGVKKADAGSYRVSISNQFGSDTCTARISIEGDDKPKSDALKKETQKPNVAGPPSPLAHAPYIFKMTDTDVSLGWRPSIPPYPQVPYTYTLEMCRLPNGAWTAYKSGIKDSSCDVRDLAPGTDYQFRVRVENKHGVSDPSPHVTAHRTLLQRPLSPADFQPKDYDLDHLKLDKYAAAPRFLRTDEEFTYAVRGHPARIEFWVYGCPQPNITWLFNNVPVEKGKYDFLEDRNGQVIMFITRMGDDDVGTYTCKAVNEHGEAQRKIQLLIAEQPVFTRRLDPTTILVRGGGEFQCRAIGVPAPKIKWFRDWHPLAESSRLHLRVQEPDSSCSLTLSDAILKDGGLYTCTATNVAGSATTSAMLSVEECENQYHLLTYKRPPFSKPSDKPFEDFYDIGDELGRGTQGITYHVAERKSGRSLAAKVMHGAGPLADLMAAEMDIMQQLCHPRLVRLWDAHRTPQSLTLALDLCGGGELLPHILHRKWLTESEVAHYIKQVLEGLQHMHEKDIAHLGLTLGDVLVTRVHCDNVKVGDFGLATRLHAGREFVQEYGHPEFVAPEIANKQPVTLAADMWSVGIIAYILLVGDSPFLRENDRATLKEVQEGRPDFFHEGFAVLSEDAMDFVKQLLQFDPTKRMDVNAALKHKWLELDSIPDKCDELNNIDRLRDYYKKWRTWHSNASCRWFFRRRTLESCFTHPSRMIYPPGEPYTPPPTPDLDLERSRVKPAAFDDLTFKQRIEREAIDPRSESHYQNGPDTFLLPLRDPDFPVRVRRYLKVGAGRSPILANHLKDKHWGDSDVAVKERRKFVDVMDEEIRDEKRGLSGSAALRRRLEVPTPGSGYEHVEQHALKKKRGFRGSAGISPFFREKLQDAVVRENEDATFEARVSASPDASVSWFRNDGILVESSRIVVKKWSDGRCLLTLKPAKAYDVGCYKCVARNCHGVTVSRARLNIGSVSGKPDPPKADKCSDSEVHLTWMPPRFDGYSPTFGYALEQQEEGCEGWTKLAGNISHEFYLVRNLSPGKTYFFRVCAVNKFGWSEFSFPSEPVMTLLEAGQKIELGRAERFQQDQTDNGQELLSDAMEPQKLDYMREDDPLNLEEAEPTDLYNYVSEVAKGRFSLTMRIWHKKDGGTFVAKALDMASPSSSDAARKEFEIYRSLCHERIAHLHSASVCKTSLFLVMEKLCGLDVMEFLSLRPLYTEETVSRIVRQVVDGLEYLHFRGLCYFELQPDNVVMEDRHRLNVKLVDFGCAQFVPEDGDRVQVNGALEYLAPEVVKSEEVHTPADIWGVGVLTYILLSGASPFAGDSAAETRENVLLVRYHFDHLHKEVTPEATHFLMQLFKRTPQKRPTTEECLDSKWLLPNEFMIKKREHAVLTSHALKDFSERFHSQKAQATPQHLIAIFGKPR